MGLTTTGASLLPPAGRRAAGLPEACSIAALLRDMVEHCIATGWWGSQ
jgi:hypothetical protein